MTPRQKRKLRKALLDLCIIFTTLCVIALYIQATRT